MKLQIPFIKRTPNSVVGTKLDTTLPHAVFVGSTTGKGQQKSWKGIRQIEAHFRSSFPAQKTVAPRSVAEECVADYRILFLDESFQIVE